MRTSFVKLGDVILGKYRVDKILGQGAMGLLVAATHLHIEQRVAFKLMLGGEGPGAETFERFIREARIMALLRTQHVARVADVGYLDEGVPYILMELLQGRDLAALLRERGPLPIAEAIEYGLQASDALAEAHAAGIVHRDIKPANLFLTELPDGSPCIKVLDFGISKVNDKRGLALTKTAQTLGSPLYMSPEQLSCPKDVDSRTDIWSLGVALYELIGGVTPFHAESIEHLMKRVMLDPPTPLASLRPDVPPGLVAVLEQCLEKPRERRFQNVAQLAGALAPFAPQRALGYVQRLGAVLGEAAVVSRPTDLLPQEPAAAPAPVTSAPAQTAPQRPPPASRSFPAALAILGLVAIAGAAMVGIFALRAAHAPRLVSSANDVAPVASPSSVALPSASSDAPSALPPVLVGSAATPTAATTASAAASVRPTAHPPPRPTASRKVLPSGVYDSRE